MSDGHPVFKQKKKNTLIKKVFFRYFEKCHFFVSQKRKKLNSKKNLRLDRESNSRPTGY